MNLADIKCNLNVEESISHFILQCPSLVVQRNKLRRNLSRLGIIILTTDVILGESIQSNEDDDTKKKITEEFGKFLKETNRLEDI